MTGASYEIQVAGAVPSTIVDELGDVTFAEQELRTVLICTLPDQAALHGTLARLRALGLELVEVRAVPIAGPTPDGGAAGEPAEDT